MMEVNALTMGDGLTVSHWDKDGWPAIEAVIFKRQRRHIARLQFHPVGYSLRDGIAPGGRLTIPGLIGSLPKIHADGASRGQALRGHEQHRTPATTQVQDSLIAAKTKRVEQLRPNDELAPQRRVKIQNDKGHHERDGHKPLPASGDDRQDEDEDGHYGHEREPIGSINPIRTASSRWRLLSHLK